MRAYVLGCPLCQQKFQVRETDLGEVLLCPHCQQQIRIPTKIDDAGANSPAAIDQTDSSEITSTSAAVLAEETELQNPDESDTKETIDWLPPKFDVPDPSKLRDRSRTINKVLLPTAEGNLQTVDQRTVTVEYKGKKYILIALSPEQKKRRQLIVNIVSIIIAIAAILVTFRILTW